MSASKLDGSSNRYRDLDLSQNLVFQTDKITEEVGAKHLISADVSSLSSCEVSYLKQNKEKDHIRYFTTTNKLQSPNPRIE